MAVFHIFIIVFFATSILICTEVIWTEKTSKMAKWDNGYLLAFYWILAVSIVGLIIALIFCYRNYFTLLETFW